MHRMPNTDIYSYDVNTGTSFMDKTFTLGGFSPYNSKGDVDKYYNCDYLHGKECIDTGLENILPLTPVSDKEITYVIEFINMSNVVNEINTVYQAEENHMNSLYGLYVKELKINANYGNTFINFLANTNLIRYLWDYVEQNVATHEMTLDGHKFEFNLPININFLIKDKELADYKINVEIVEYKEPFINTKAKTTLLKYRNFDMYISNYKYINGYLANLSPLAKDIEKFFVSTSESYCTPNELGEGMTLDDKVLEDFLITNQYAYSGETYELKTPTALIIGKVSGKIDNVVNDVLGRISTKNSAYRYPGESTSITEYMYSNLLNLVGFYLEQPSGYRVDKAINHDKTIGNIAEKISNGNNHYFITYLESMFNYFRDKLSFSYFKTSDLGVQFQFNSMLERINMIREIVCLSLPNSNIYNRTKYYNSDFTSNDLDVFRHSAVKPDTIHLTPVYCGKPLKAKITNNDFLNLTSYLPSAINYEEYFDLFDKLYRDRQLIYSEVSNPYLTNLKGRATYKTPQIGLYTENQYSLEGYEEVGTHMVTFMPLMPILKLQSDFRQLKNLLALSIKFDELTLDISDNVEFEIEYGKKRGTSQLILDRVDLIKPTDWREIQLPDISANVPTMSSMHEPLPNTKFYTSNPAIRITQFKTVSPAPSAISNNFVNTVLYRNDMSDIHLPYLLATDPFLSIRNQISYDEKTFKAYRNSQTGVIGFGATNQQTQEPPAELDKEILRTQPITNYGLFCLDDNSKDKLLVPMLGTLCAITKDKDLSELNNYVKTVNPVDAMYDSTTEMLSKRRYNI